MSATPRDLVAVFDVGKTNAKLVVARAGTGEVVWSRAQPNPAGAGEPYRHVQAEALEAFLLSSLADAPAKARIAAIVPVTHGACAALVTESGLALPILDYEEPRIEEVSEAYDRERDAFTETFSPALPFGLNLGRQLYWLQRAFPREFREATALLPYPQYWAWRLSGVVSCEITSLGAHTDLWRPLARAPARIAEREGWAALLPPLRSASDLLGPIRPEIAARTGLDPETRVHCGIHDSNASFLRHRLARKADEPFTVISTGTWTIAMANGVGLAHLVEAKDTLANVNALGEPVATARFMGGREYETLLHGAVADAKPGLDDLARVLESRALALPSFAQTGGPFPGRRGSLQGAEALSHDERAALASLYLALMTDHVLDLLGARGTTVIEGSFAENGLYCGALAALRPAGTVSRSTDQTGTLGGALALATGSAPRADLSSCMPVLTDRISAYRIAWRNAVGPL